MNLTIPDLAALVDDTRASRGHVTASPFTTTSADDANEYLLFLKPELTDTPERLALGWDIVSGVLKGARQEITALAAAHSSYLERHRLIEAHYGVINQVSSRGADAMSAPAQQKLQDLQSAAAPHAPVLGGHQFLERYPDWSAQDLAKLYDSLDNIKFASGTYGVVADVDHDKVIILNGFHPQQIAYFYEGDKVIVLMTVKSHSTWADIRGNITGATDPSRAVAGSIRGRLLADEQRLGYEVATARNGVHVSAGPIEAAVEISRYMSDFDSSAVIETTDVRVVRSLAERFDSDFVGTVLDNGVLVTDSIRSPSFDVTEEVDAWAVADLLEKWRPAGS